MSSVLFPDARELLRQTRHGTLATQSTVLPGYPHASFLPYVCDEAGRVLLVMSRLAEHTQNVLQDEKVSFLVHDAAATLSGARLTILGDLLRVESEPLLLARLTRQNPTLAGYLQMSDFAVWRLWPRRARYIAGFGKMGWLEGDEWESAACLSLADEAQLLHEFANELPIQLAGIDLAGYDVRSDEQLKRHRFEQLCADVETVRATLKQLSRKQI
ncbi:MULTISPECIES: HugZ family pyridoxamine 5'-phosphate oxidase [Deefgea]|uniref:Pyridoxamine 5'-phosphate oxidase n=1 Tax=Deefgea chitinilytica TaxID=570276 RepID=A0ABS2CD99_9NEIS|nr:MULTISPECIES: pyridoxamine 5'-phosphate oxidase family protein [Deefgea]MBM5572116.1 pyridoxamine 5'-phosphate oxidase [Deefgea chitinilytica]MBM9889351.1 pyridoxamine 5'-phosphate oxidase family protein [Deefgea sp. CFH1-16]